MSYAPATYAAPPRARLADAGRARPRRRYARRLWAWWSIPASAAQVARAGYVLLLVGVALVALALGIVIGNATYDDTVVLQQAVAL